LGFQNIRHLLNPINFAAQSANSMDGSLSTHAFPSREAARVLILGCGNSKFGEDMQRDGWTGEIVNVDFSSVVIDQMQSKYSDEFYKKTLPKARKMEFKCADMTKLPYEDNSFDLIVVKGSFDAVLCSAGAKCSALRVVQETVRLLAPGHGIFFLVTHGNPDSRIEFLEYENQLDHYWYGVNVFNVVRPSDRSVQQQRK
jgi:SAM-dependent methyltransferase